MTYTLWRYCPRTGFRETIEFDGPRGDVEWGDDTQALCRGCGWADILGEAKPT